MAISTEVSNHLQEHYDQDIHKILFEDGKITSPVLASAEAKKIREGGGKKFVVRALTHEGAAVAADPEVADDIAGDGSAGGRPGRERWEVDMVSMDSPFTFDRDEVDAVGRASKSEQFDIIAEEMDLAVIRVRNIMAEQVCNNGWGATAQISAITSTTTTVPADRIHLFPVGTRFQASATEDTDVLYNNGAQLRVTGQNTSTNVVTWSGNPQTTWANVATLWLFRAGMRGVADPAQTDSNKKTITGLSGWVDPAATTTLFGVTRANTPQLLGLTVSGSGMDTGQALIAVAEKGFQFGKKMDCIFVNGTSWKLLMNDYDASRIVEQKVGPYNIGFPAFNLQTMFGMVKVMPDPNIAQGTAFGGPFLDKQLCPRLYYSGKNLVNLDDLDGKRFERVTENGSRKYKGQFYFRGNFVLPGPGNYVKGTSLPTS